MSGAGDYCRIMKRFKGFGARRSFESPTPNYIRNLAFVQKTSQVVTVGSSSPKTPPQCFPHLYSPAREPARTRRCSVDKRTNRDRGFEFVGRNPPGGTQIRTATSSSGSFSSTSEFQSSSSRHSDASAASSDCFFNEPHPRAVVVGFDANARDARVWATILWAFQNVVEKGDVVVLVGVINYIRGPLGYKMQVSERTWLGPNKTLLQEEVRKKNAAWSQMTGLRNLCEEAGVRAMVDVKVAQRAEVVIVQEATALSAAQVVLDQSLNNRRRRYYMERLTCAVIRMRRSGGVEKIRSLASIVRTRDAAKERIVEDLPASPTSVIPPPAVTSHQFELGKVAKRPTRGGAETQATSFNSSLSRLVKLVHEKKSSLKVSRDSGTHDDEAELFTIDHVTSPCAMALEAEPYLTDPYLNSRADSDFGYDSDDLFSLCGDGAGAPRRPSLAIFSPAETQSARASAVSSHDPAIAYFLQPLSSLDSGACLNKRFLIPS